MSVEDESTSCYCLLDPFACHVLLDSFGTYALTGEPITDSAVKQLKVAVFGCMSCNSLDYNLRVYCVDNTPCAFQVSLFVTVLLCVCALRIMTVCISFFYVAVINYHDQKQLMVKRRLSGLGSKGKKSVMLGILCYGSRSEKLADCISMYFLEEESGNEK